MSDKMPEMTEEAVRDWLWSIDHAQLSDSDNFYAAAARAVLALVEARVKLAAAIAYDLYAQPFDPDAETAEQYGERHAAISREIVSRVLGRDGGAR